MIKIAILDDDESFVQEVVESVEQAMNQLKMTSEVICFTKTDSFLAHLSLEFDNIDLVILDIKLINTSGITLAQKINKKYPKIKIVFITGYNEYSKDISEANFVYYLLKPIDHEKLKNALKKVSDMVQAEQNDVLSLKKRGKIININVRDIEYAESCIRTVRIYFFDKNWLEVTLRLDELEKMLSGYNLFLRIHQSYLINMNNIRAMEGLNIRTYTNKDFIVPQKRLASVKQNYLEFLKKKTNVFSDKR